VPLPLEFVKRDCPLSKTWVKNLKDAVGPIDLEEVPTYLKRYGFMTFSASKWPEATPNMKPMLTLGVIKGHREAGNPVLHTWYALRARISMEGAKTWRWQVERRLEHLRKMLHDPVKLELAKTYDLHFGTARFAKHGGPPGTTARLEGWLAALAKVINEGSCSPQLVALTLRFLEAPEICPDNRTDGGLDEASFDNSLAQATERYTEEERTEDGDSEAPARNDDGADSDEGEDTSRARIDADLQLAGLAAAGVTVTEEAERTSL